MKTMIKDIDLMIAGIKLCLKDGFEKFHKSDLENVLESLEDFKKKILKEKELEYCKGVLKK